MQRLDKLCITTWQAFAVMAMLFGLSGVAFAAVSTQFTVSGSVTAPATFDLAGLQALPATPPTTVTFLSGNVPETHTYIGTSLWGLLNDVGIVTDSTIKNDILRKYLVAIGSDGYQAIFSLGEIDPLFGNQPDFIAYSEVINGVTQPLGANGFARVVVPGDVRGGRYVSNLVSLQILDASALPVPEPSTWIMLIAGLAWLGFLGYRRGSNNWIKTRGGL